MDTAEKIRSIYNCRAPVESALERVPEGANVLLGNFEWDAIENLINAFCSIKGAQEAVATKILNKKRPKSHGSVAD